MSSPSVSGAAGSEWGHPVLSDAQAPLESFSRCHKKAARPMAGLSDCRQRQFLSFRTSDRCHWCGNPHLRNVEILAFFKNNGLPRQCAHLPRNDMFRGLSTHWQLGQCRAVFLSMRRGRTRGHLARRRGRLATRGGLPRRRANPAFSAARERSFVYRDKGAFLLLSRSEYGILNAIHRNARSDVV